MTGASRSTGLPAADGTDRAAARWIPRRVDLALLAPALLCGACVGCRWQPFDAPPLIAAAALTPVAVVPAALATLAAVVLRRPRAALAGIACVLAASAVLVPHRPASEPGQPGQSGTPVTLVTGNLYFRNPTPGAAVEAVFSLRPDVVVLQEVSPEVAARLQADAAAAGYPWTALRPRWGSTGLAVLSRYRIVDQQLRSAAGQPLLQVDLDVNGTLVSLLAVHLEAPVSRAAAARWRAQLAALGEIIGSTLPRPLVVAGDFNATLDHAPFRRLVAPPLRDVAAQSARRWSPTWPVGRLPVPPLFQLDHVVLSSGLSATSLRTGSLPGSDHRLLVTSVLVPAPAAGR